MSRGSRKLKRTTTAAPGPVDDPTIGDVPRRVWFIATERQSDDQDAIRFAVERACKENGWAFSMRRSKFQRVLGGEEKDKPYRSLTPKDATDIYQDLHLNRCLVVATHACYIKADPSHDPVSLRELISLGDFVAYKAAFVLARGSSAALSAVGDFGQWPPADGCNGQHDARVLPLHSFDPSICWLHLDAAEQRSRFDQHYRRKAGSRSDVGGRTWQTPNGLHGAAGVDREALTVAGHTLPLGYHWDVERGRGKATMTTESEVWHLGYERAYLNIYPNGYVRGERNRGAKRVWPQGRK